MPSSRERLTVVINHSRSGINISLATFSRGNACRKKYGDLCDLGDLRLGAPAWVDSSFSSAFKCVVNQRATTHLSHLAELSQGIHYDPDVILMPCLNIKGIVYCFGIPSGSRCLDCRLYLAKHLALRGWPLWTRDIDGSWFMELVMDSVYPKLLIRPVVVPFTWTSLRQ